MNGIINKTAYFITVVALFYYCCISKILFVTLMPGYAKKYSAFLNTENCCIMHKCTRE